MQTPVQQISTPENYNYSKHESDISVLQVEGTFPLGEINCDAIELPFQCGFARNGDILNITGWGYKNNEEKYFSVNLQLLTLRSVKNAKTKLQRNFVTTPRNTP